MDQATIFSIVFIAGFGIVALLHSLGIYLLHEVKTNLFNQKVLVINLALSEFLFSLHQVFLHSVSISGYWNSTLTCIDIFMICLLYSVIRLIVLHIILDRFADIYLNVKYSLYMDSKKTKFIVTAGWILSAILAATLTVLFSYQYLFTHQIWRIIDTAIIILDLVILISAISS